VRYGPEVESVDPVEPGGVAYVEETLVGDRPQPRHQQPEEPWLRREHDRTLTPALALQRRLRPRCLAHSFSRDPGPPDDRAAIDEGVADDLEALSSSAKGSPEAGLGPERREACDMRVDRRSPPVTLIGANIVVEDPPWSCAAPNRRFQLAQASETRSAPHRSDIAGRSVRVHRRAMVVYNLRQVASFARRAAETEPAASRVRVR